MICPDCNGKRQVFAHLSYGGEKPGEFKHIDCFRCKGAGEVPDEQAAWIEAGKKRRSERAARDVTLREEAQRLGMTAAQLSACERGMQPFPASAEHS